MRKSILLLTISVITLTGCATLISDAPELSSPELQGYEKVGNVSADNVYWNWLFQKDAEERRDKLMQTAAEKAAKEYGEEAIILLEKAEGKWSPKSLLMLFSTIGYVEDASLEASVWLPETPPVPEAPPVKYGIRYVVIPEENYTSDTQFMLVEYKTKDQLETELTTLFKNDKLTEESFFKKKSRLPEVGEIFVTLGREDITNAISRWFTFSCFYNGERIFRYRGTEDIPYVYGTDKLWWNDMSYRVDKEWDGELVFQAEDSYQNRVFNFRIVKERYIIEADTDSGLNSN